MTPRTGRFWFALVLGVAALALIPAALAAKGGRSASGSTAPRVALSTPGPYSFGQAIQLTTDVPAYPDGAGPYIWLKCYQGSTLVLAMDHAAFPGGMYYGDPFWLGPTQSWSSGAADCTAKVVHLSGNRIVVDGETSFHVDG